MDLIKHSGPADITAPQLSLTSETSHWTSSSLDSVPLHSSSRLQTLISKLNAKFTFIWKEDFGPLSNSLVLFILSPGKMLLTMFLFQTWLGSPFLEDVWAWWLLIHWLQLQFSLCEALPSVWIGFAGQNSQACIHSCFLCNDCILDLCNVSSAMHLIWLGEHALQIVQKRTGNQFKYFFVCSMKSYKTSSPTTKLWPAKMLNEKVKRKWRDVWPSMVTYIWNLYSAFNPS